MPPTRPPRSRAAALLAVRRRPRRIRRAAIVVLAGMATVACSRAAEPPSEHATAADRAQADHFVILPDQVRWIEPPPQADFFPDGVKLALIEGGSPLDKGPFTFRLRFPAGSRLMPHTHPTTAPITVISGTAHHARGRVFDPAATEPLAAGGFLYLAAEEPHFIRFDEETVLQFHGNGPFGLTYLNPADDPRNQE